MTPDVDYRFRKWRDLADELSFKLRMNRQRIEFKVDLPLEIGDRVSCQPLQSGAIYYAGGNNAVVIGCSICSRSGHCAREVVQAFGRSRTLSSKVFDGREAAAHRSWHDSTRIQIGLATNFLSSALLR
jgi:hypothetical protein